LGSSSTPGSLQHCEVVDKNATRLTLKDIIERYHRSLFANERTMLSISFGYHLFDISGAEATASPLEPTDLHNFSQWLSKGNQTPRFSARIPGLLMNAPVQTEPSVQQIVYSGISDVSGDVKSSKSLTLSLPYMDEGLCNVDNRLIPELTSEISANILVPARVSDMQLTLRRREALPTGLLPQQLLACFENTQGDVPDSPPLKLSYGGVDYNLTSYERQQISYALESNHDLRINLRAITDLLTGESSSSCSIDTEDWENPEIWNSLVIKCDELVKPHQV